MLPGETSLITLRLHGSIPAAAGRELKAALTRAQAAGTDYRRAQKQFFAAYDAVLDRAPIGPQYFDNEKVAETLAGELLMLEETGFRVPGFAILPNHAHVVLHLPADSRLAFAKALDLLHLRTATNCRRLVRPRLPPEAEFWQPGWFAYSIEDEAELVRIRRYVRGNAARAGLPARFQQWPYVND